MKKYQPRLKVVLSKSRNFILIYLILLKKPIDEDELEV